MQGQWRGPSLDRATAEYSSPPPPSLYILKSSFLSLLPSVLSLCLFMRKQLTPLPLSVGLPDGPSGKESTCQCGGHKSCSFNPWVRKTPGGGNGNALQYSCLESPWTEEPGGLRSMW